MERARESSKNQKGFYEGTVIETQVRSWLYGLNLFKIDACVSRSYVATFPRANESASKAERNGASGASERVSFFPQCVAIERRSVCRFRRPWQNL